MADAGSGGDTRESSVGDERDALAVLHVLEGGGDLVGLGHARARTDADQCHDVTGVHGPGFQGGDGLALTGEHPHRTLVGEQAVGPDQLRRDSGALHQRALGREVAAQKGHGARQATGAGLVGRHDDLPRIDVVEVEKLFAQAGAALALLPPGEVLAERATSDRAGVEFEQTEVAQVQHRLRYTAGEVDLHRGEVTRAVGKRVDETRNLAVEAGPVLHGRTPQAGRVGDGRDVQHEIGRAAEGRVADHRVVDGVVGQDVACHRAGEVEAEQGAGGAAGDVAPDGRAGGGERGVGQGESEGLRHDLAGSRGAHELAATAGRTTGAAAHLRGVLEGDFVAGEAGGESLDLAGVLGLLCQQRNAARHEHRRQIGRTGERHEHRGQTLVAGGDAEHAAPRGQGADQPAQDHGGVVAVGQTVEHAVGAIGAPVAGIADVAGEGNGLGRGEHAGRLLHQQADLPVPGVVTERDRCAVRCTDAALGAQNEKLFAQHRGRRPTHAGVLGPAEEIAAGHSPQLVGIERKTALRTGRLGAQRVDRVVAGIEDGIGHGIYDLRFMIHDSGTEQTVNHKSLIVNRRPAAGITPRCSPRCRWARW